MGAANPGGLLAVSKGMSHDAHSFRKLSPRFVIPAGTQVVLKVVKQLADGGFKKTGTVGVVVQSPPRNEGPYVVQFSDGRSVEARFDELALRRREVDDELRRSDEDLDAHVIYRCQVGSKAFGLATEDSDDDLRGIYMPPARRHWSLYALPEQIERTSDTADEVYWELEKFLRLALKANPNVLETLWTPLVLLESDVSRELRSLRGAFLSKHLYKTYSGYVLSQFRRMANTQRRTGAYKAKHAMHLVRLLHCGIAALETGEILVDASAHRHELLEIRSGNLPLAEVECRAHALDQRFQAAFERTMLPEQPDYARIDDFLIRSRRRMVDD
jgi:hypothetical protein